MRYLIVGLVLFFIGCSSSNNSNVLNFEYEFEKGLEFIENNNYKKAKKIFLSLDEIDSTVIGVKMNLALIYQEENDIDNAKIYLMQAHKLDPNHIVVVRRLYELTGEEKYEKLITELRDRVIELSSEQYYIDIVNKNPIVNKEYAKFSILLTGKIISVKLSDNVVLLNGQGDKTENTVECIVSNLTQEEKSGLKKEDIITFKGICFGIGKDLEEPLFDVIEIVK